jgi:hypothetical protein
MLRHVIAVFIAVSVLSPAVAQAGGWSGGEGWMVRDRFHRGHTLTFIGDKLDRR